MITQRVWFAVIAAAMVVAGGSGWAMAAHATTVDPAPIAAFDMFSVLQPTTDQPAIESHLDVYGNEIQDAITDYRVDTQGVIYEFHSPETEVARLGPPIM
jgi:hypothetical protein